jgi:heat shock protein HslJ
MRPRVPCISALIALSVIAVACAPSAGDTANGGLANTSWTVTSVGGVATVDPPRPTMTFAPDGTVTGNAGCNQYSGTYRTDGSSITISNVASTMMMCAGAAAQVEPVFLKGLNGATTWRETETGQLEIAGVVGIVAGPGVAEVPPGDAPPVDASPMELPGTSWVLTEMGGTADLAHIVPTLAFGLEGTVSGFAGCNTFSGTYTPDGHIASLISTKIGCQPPASIIESDYLKALSDVRGWTLVEGRLVLDGAIQLTFAPG